MDNTENDASNNTSLSRNVFTEPLPSNAKEDTHTDTKTDVIIYVPSFIKIGSDIQNVFGADTHTDTQTAR
jgi:hypothetical protein